MQVAQDSCHLDPGFGCLFSSVFFLCSLFYSCIIKEAVKWTLFAPAFLHFDLGWFIYLDFAQKTMIGSLFHVQKWQRMNDKQGHIIQFDCISFTSCFALSGTAFPPLLVSSYCCSWFLWNSVITVEPHGASLRNVHARSFAISQLSSAWAEMTFVQSLQELAQWVFVVKKK